MLDLGRKGLLFQFGGYSSSGEVIEDLFGYRGSNSRASLVHLGPYLGYDTSEAIPVEHVTLSVVI